MVYLQLTYMPINTDCIHVYLNGVEQYEDTDWVLDEYARINTLGPMDVWSSDLLEARYYHRFETPDVPVDDPAVVSNVSLGIKVITGTSATATFPAPPAVGSTVLVATHSSFATVTGMTGLGATWTKILGTTGQFMTIWVGIGCDGTGTTVTASKASASTIIVSAVEVTGVTVTGLQSTTGTGTVQGPLTAPAGGGIAFSAHGTSSGTAPVSATPRAWTEVPAPDNGTDVYVIALSSGESAGQTMGVSGTWGMILLGAS